MDIGITIQDSFSSDQSINNKPHVPKPLKTIQTTPDKSVNFTTNPVGEKKREKYLTAKYGAHQMALIRKRLKVEMWMFDQLQEICDSQVRNKKKSKNV